MAEVNVSVGRKRSGDGSYASTTLTQAADATLGPGGGVLVTSAYLLTSCTLLVAYLSKAGEVLLPIQNYYGGDGNSQLTGALFGCAGSLLLYCGGTGAADHVNRVLTGLLLAAFGYITVCGASVADFQNLTAVSEWHNLAPAVPILFLSLVYHDLVPVLCMYMGGDLPRVRTTILAGGTVPLVMFLVWNSVALSVGGTAAGDPLLLLADQGIPLMGTAVSAFCLLAIATSFMGTFLGVTSYLELQLGAILGCAPSSAGAGDSKPSGPPSNEAESGSRAGRAKLLAFLLATLPPMAVYWNNSDSFLPAAQFAGAYGMTTLYALLPPAMGWALAAAPGREGADAGVHEGNLVMRPGVGGRMVLASMMAAAVGFESFKAAVDIGFFDRGLGDAGAASNLVVPELAAIADSIWSFTNAL